MLELKFLIEAPIAFTSDWRGVLVLLLDTLVELLALGAAEGANLQLWLDLGGARHCALNGHDAAQADRLEVPDLVKIRHVVEANLVPLRIGNLVSLVGKESGEALSEVRLKAHILALQPVHEVGVLPVVARHVGIVNEQGPRLVVLNFLRATLVIVNLGALVILLPGVRLKVRVIPVQSEAISQERMGQRRENIQGLMIKRKRESQTKSVRQNFLVQQTFTTKEYSERSCESNIKEFEVKALTW